MNTLTRHFVYTPSLKINAVKRWKPSNSKDSMVKNKILSSKRHAVSNFSNRSSSAKSSSKRAKENSTALFRSVCTKSCRSAKWMQMRIRVFVCPLFLLVAKRIIENAGSCSPGKWKISLILLAENLYTAQEETVSLDDANTVATSQASTLRDWHKQALAGRNISLGFTVWQTEIYAF